MPENHLHRFRDVELREDDLPAMGANMSRMCGWGGPLAIGEYRKRPALFRKHGDPVT